MSGLFNSYFYGKAGKADFTPDQLPKNRIELFFSVLKQQLGKLVQLNLLYDLFCLPMFVWLYINYALLSNMAESGSISDFYTQGYLSMFLILLLPCLVLMGLGSAGQMYVLRNWSRDQHSFMLSDFKDSIKNNWKQGLVFGLINGISLPLIYFCYVVYGSMAQSNVIFMIPQVLMIVIGCVWWMMNMLNFPMLVSYEMKTRDIIRNSALMAVARLPFSVLFLVVTFALPIGLLLVPYGIVIMPFFYILIGFSLTGLIQASYATSSFDKYLNPRIAGAKVGQGMRDPALDYMSEEEQQEVEEEAKRLQ